MSRGGVGRTGATDRRGRRAAAPTATGSGPAETDGAFWLIGDKAFIALVVVAIWRWWPFAFLMLMAGLQSIPADVYEAAALDGAKPLRQWWSITLPMLRPVNLVLLLNMFLWTFNDFNTPYVLFGTAASA